MKKFLLVCLLAVTFAACSNDNKASEPELTIRDGVYGVLLYITLDPMDSIYSRTNGIQLVLDKKEDQWNICTIHSCYDTTMANSALNGIAITNDINLNGCEFTMTETFTVSLYPDGTGNVIEGLYTYELVDCTMEPDESWYLEAYVFGMHIDTIL